MKVQQITEEYELDHDLKITNHLKEQKVYKIKSYRGFKLTQLDNHEPNPLLQLKNNDNNNQKQFSKNNHRQPLKHVMNTSGQKSTRGDSFKPQSYPIPIVSAYKQKKNSQKRSLVVMVLIMVAVTIVCLILVQTLFPESQFNLLKNFTLDTGENRKDGSL